MSSPLHRYRLHGVRIASELALPELEEDCSPHAAEVIVRCGATPVQLSRIVRRSASVAANRDALLFTLPGTARYLVERGASITIDIESTADPEIVRLFLLGTAWAACCQQRGLLLMHASVARMGNQAVAFVGPSGAGKSTTAALLAACGYEIAADDSCVIHFDAAGLPWIMPAHARMKLWSDALPILPAAAASAHPAALQSGKFKLNLAEHWCNAPLPLRCVLELADDRDGTQPGFQRLGALHSMRVLLSNTFRARLLRLQGRQRENFRACGAVARAVRVHRWVRPWGAARQGEMIYALERWLVVDGRAAARYLCVDSSRLVSVLEMPSS